MIESLASGVWPDGPVRAVSGGGAPFDPAGLLIHKELEAPALRRVTLLVARRGGINLSQGTCLLPAPDIIKEAAAKAMHDGENRYSPADGIPRLREALAGKLRSFNGIPCDPSQVAVASGSTGALEAICSAFLQRGDQAILFEPTYPYHRDAFERYGAEVRTVPLRGRDWEFDPEELDRAVTPRTKLVLVCNPGNPTGKVFTRGELAAIGEVCRRRGILCVSDEVYEYITYDGRPHVSMASLPGMFEHTITIGSYSKTFAITGWRVGYFCAPASVYQHLRSAADHIYICPNVPAQYGVARGIEALGPGYYADQLAAYARKREILCGALRDAGFSIVVPQGAYYVIARTDERFPGLTSEEVAFGELIERADPGSAVGAVPASDFLGRGVLGDPDRSNFLRFCFALPDADLERAAALLRQIDR